MDQQQIIDHISNTFGGLDVVKGEEGIAPGDTFFIYDPQRNLDLKHRFPFATIVTHDYGDVDAFSHLNRPGVFRLNIGVSRNTFTSLFGSTQTDQDFTALDQLIPHPVYATQSWVSVLNPSEATFQSAVQPLLAEAYLLAVRRSQR
jgi:Family of unknown function (DUF6194)